MKAIEVQGKTIDDAIEKALEELQVTRDQVSVQILEEGSRGLLGLLGTRPAKIKVTINQGATYNAIKEELQAAQQEPSTPVITEEAPKATASVEPTPPPQARAPKNDAPRKQERKESVQRQKAEDMPKKQYSEEEIQAITTRAKEALKVLLERLQVEYTVEVRRRDDQILLNIHCDNENFLIGRRGTTLDAVQYLVNRIANKNVEDKIQVVLDTSDYRVNRKERLQKLALRLSRKVKMTGKSVTVAPMNPHDRRIIHLTLQDDPGIKTLSRGTGFMRRIIISSSSKKSPRRNNSKKN